MAEHDVKSASKNMNSAMLSVLSAIFGMVVNSVPAEPSEKPLVDKYQYTFVESGYYKTTDGDEFEYVDLIYGDHSGLSAYDKDGGLVLDKQSLKDSVGLNTAAPNGASKANSSFVDSREDNDSFENASSVYDVGYWESGIYWHSTWLDATISQKTKGILWWQEKYTDKDFYSFDACTVGTLTVRLSNIPPNCDYDIRAYRLDDSTSANASSLDFDNYISISQNSSNNNETIVLSVRPGNYYFCVYSYHTN